MFRLPPAMPITAYKTYAISSPVSTHFRDGTCEEADCPNWHLGWRTLIDESTELGQAQAYYLRHDRSRHCTEERGEDGMTVFVFEPGQPCFATPHKVPLGRPELFVVRGGDWRGNPLNDHYQHSGAESWLDDFSTHQDRILTLIERG